ncbi:MAG: hypothetical protein JO290_12715 [Sphingomonadaceae bacterium]|nr:hypothetical protein [Sphingomonadaceae bacterium]
MAAVIDTLEYAERFESAGFEHDKARVLAAAFAVAGEAAREELVTKPFLELRLAELEARLMKQLGDQEARLNRQLGDFEVRLTRQIGEVGNGLSNRLWSTVAIIAGVSTTISATVGADVALLLHKGF